MGKEEDLAEVGRNQETLQTQIDAKTATLTQHQQELNDLKARRDAHVARGQTPPGVSVESQHTTETIPSASETSPALSSFPTTEPHPSPAVTAAEAPNSSDSKVPRLRHRGNKHSPLHDPRSKKPSVNGGPSTTDPASACPTNNLATQKSATSNPSRTARKSDIPWPSTSTPPTGLRPSIPSNFDMSDMIEKAGASEKRAKALQDAAINHPPVVIADDYQDEAAQRHNREKSKMQAEEYEAAKGEKD
ncbi:hypothetical protein Slin15195_G076570 [Septoria linicola]|uniref:Uncharacterized protein n=1 Tax=Septoria linicola TaxID=215465 RepID=A0A9Q9AWA3_9PEZI|nr:hypothetical protein Slin15195_G076570 [Septoria linicola]